MKGTSLRARYERGNLSCVSTQEDDLNAEHRTRINPDTLKLQGRLIYEVTVRENDNETVLWNEQIRNRKSKNKRISHQNIVTLRTNTLLDMPGRTSGDYRYGFNGKEKDKDGEIGSLTHSKEKSVIDD